MQIFWKVCVFKKMVLTNSLGSYFTNELYCCVQLTQKDLDGLVIGGVGMH